jgi:hypothetical protein
VLGRHACWLVQNAATAISSPAAKVRAPATAALAASTARRRGRAAKVVRISPVVCSELIASTPSTPKASWAIARPAKLNDTGSQFAFPWELMAAQLVVLAT